MYRRLRNVKTPAFAAAALALVLVMAPAASAVIDGISPTAGVVNLTAGAGEVSTPDGNAILFWGYGNAGGLPQYPGPTLIVNQGDTVTINLANQLSEPVSIVFPGQPGVTAVGGSLGMVTREAPAGGGSVSYTVTFASPGTFHYESGTRPELQVEMGLFGAIIVRPTGYDATTNRIAYDDPRTAYDHEYLFVLSEMDDSPHDLVNFNRMAELDNTIHAPVYWFINGRLGPDTLLPNNVPWLPHQPYGALAQMHPGETVLIRAVGAGRDMHPFHTHGNNFSLIGRDGKLLSWAGSTQDFGVSDFTMTVEPGATYDALFGWTGYGMGWDIYGHSGAPALVDVVDNKTGVAATTGPCIPGDCFDDTTWEYTPDHNKPIPVQLPNLKDLTFGAFYSGSPYLGAMGSLPVGEGGLNLNGGFFFMWHSHTERELVNNDIFPGGMLTMLIIEPPGVAIP